MGSVQATPPASLPRRPRRLGCAGILGLASFLLLVLVVAGGYLTYRFVMTDILLAEPLVFKKRALSASEVADVDWKMATILQRSTLINASTQRET